LWRGQISKVHVLTCAAVILVREVAKPLLSAALSLQDSKRLLESRQGWPQPTTETKLVVTNILSWAWTLAGMKQLCGGGVTCSHSWRSGTPSSGTLRGSGGGGGGETFGVCFLILGGWGLWGERERDRERESFNPLYSYPFVPEQSRYKGEHILHFANP
jgi:hypothetical protein